jgi:hypothetical protein
MFGDGGGVRSGAVESAARVLVLGSRRRLDELRDPYRTKGTDFLGS